MSKLTKAQRAILRELPDWIGVGLPASVVGGSGGIMKRLLTAGFIEREQPNEEWPYVYAITPAGRAALNSQSNGAAG